MILHYLGSPNVITRTPKSGREGRRGVRVGEGEVTVEASQGDVLWEGLSPTSLALKIQEGHMPRSAGIPRSWKQEESMFSSRGSRKEPGTADTLVQPSETHAGFQPPELWHNGHIYIVLSPDSVLICYSSHGKLTKSTWMESETCMSSLQTWMMIDLSKPKRWSLLCAIEGNYAHPGTGNIWRGCCIMESHCLSSLCRL